MSSLTLREQVAEPANLWIRYSFSRWPAGDGELWCDLASGSLPPTTIGPPPDTEAAADLVRSVTDVVYVPPLSAGDDRLRAGLFDAAAGVGVPLLIQVVAAYNAPTRQLVATVPGRGHGAGAPPSEPSVELPRGAVVAVDLLDALLRHAAELRSQWQQRRQPALPFEPTPLADATVVWPLVAGWTDQPALLESAIARLAAAGARRVVPRSMQLGASERRLLAEGLQSSWPEAFDALFHGGDSPPDSGAFRQAAQAAGLDTRLPRPLPAPPLPPRLRRARELAGHLIELGDAAGTGGDAHYRAARFLDRGEVDIDAAAREGNLGVLPWLEEPARVAVEEWLTRPMQPARKRD